MGKYVCRLSAASAKNLSGVLLAALGSALIFLLSVVILQNSFYAVPLLALITLPLAIAATNSAWRAASACMAVLVFSLLEFTVNADTTPLSPIFALYAACILSTISLIGGGLYWRIRTERDSYGEQSARERSISALSTELLTAATAEELYALTLRSLFSVTGCPSVLFIPDGEDGVRRAGSCPEGLLLYPVEDSVLACINTGKRTGYGTSLYRKNPLCCFPVMSDGEVLAVVGVLIDVWRDASAYQLQTVELLLVRVGVALKRLALMRREQKILMEKELERMRSDFLRSISHDLRTPLTGIIGACSALNQDDVALDDAARRDLIQSVGEEAAWLLRMVENLLSVTRVGSSGPKLNKSYEPIEEVLSETLEKARNRFPNAKITVVQPAEFLMIPMDPTLIVQVLMNLIENAVKYSGSAARIDLIAEDENAYVSFTVRDYGRGLSREALATMFEPSACRTGDSKHGMGLGLSICKSIVKAHGGEIHGCNGDPCGAVFTLTLPKEDSDYECEANCPYH